MATMQPRTSAINPVNLSLQNLGVDGRQVRAESMFCYSTPTVVTLATSASSTSNIQFQSDSVFQALRLSFLAFVSGTPTTAITYPPILLQIADTSSGANLFDTAIPLGAIAYGGAGFGPFDLPAPRFFARNATATLTFTNLSASVAYSVYFNLQGRKLFA